MDSPRAYHFELQHAQLEQCDLLMYTVFECLSLAVRAFAVADGNQIPSQRTLLLAMKGLIQSG